MSRVGILVGGFLLAATLLACSGARETESVANEPDASSGADGSGDAISSSDGSGLSNDVDEPDAAINFGWTNETNIQGIFQTYCAPCHGAQWSSCWNVQANAAIIDEMVSTGAMPRNGGFPSSDKATLLAWLDAGAPCTGTPQPFDAGGGPPPPPSGAPPSSLPY
jgi:hypothetical protein